MGVSDWSSDVCSSDLVARSPGDVERLADIVALDDGDHVGRKAMLVHQPAYAQTRLEPQRDIGHHVGQLLLVELCCGERAAELLAVKPVLARGVQDRKRVE